MGRKVALLFVWILVLPATVFAAPLAQEESEGIPWLLWLLVLVVLGLFVGYMIWWWQREPQEHEPAKPLTHYAPAPHEPVPPQVPVIEVRAGAGEMPLPDTQPVLAAEIGPVENRLEDLPVALPERGDLEAVTLPETELLPATPDDLTRIEGIGPVIQRVLAAVGIDTFRELAATDPDRLREILREADPHLARMFDPTTWPEQAHLADEGQWEALKILQAQLNRGRRA